MIMTSQSELCKGIYFFVFNRYAQGLISQTSPAFPLRAYGVYS